MVNKNLLNDIGIQVNPQYADEVETMSNREVIRRTIDSTYRSGRIRDYFSMGLGLVLFAEGFADLGADILERVASVTTTRDFNLYSALELAIGVVIVYLGIRARNKKETALKSLASSLNEYYVKD